MTSELSDVIRRTANKKPVDANDPFYIGFVEEFLIDLAVAVEADGFDAESTIGLFVGALHERLTSVEGHGIDEAIDIIEARVAAIRGVIDVTLRGQ